MFILSLVLIFLMGACIGSFLNVVILRLPSLEHSFFTKRSYCYNCHQTLLWRDLVPIFSWFYLRGRCRFCHHRFSMRYTLIELSIAVLALTCALFGDSPVQALEIFIFCTVLVAIAFIDLDTWTIPLQLPILLMLTGLGFAYEQDLDLFYARFIGLLAGFSFFALFLLGSTWFLRRVGRLQADENSMGWGDPVLIGAIGANLGWFWLSWVVLLGSLQGIIVYFLFSFSRKPFQGDEWVPPQKSMPFGPFLALSAIEIALWNLV